VKRVWKRARFFYARIFFWLRGKNVLLHILHKRKVMSKPTFKEQLKAIFQKFNTDPSAHGVKFEEEMKFEAEAKLQDGTSIYTTGAAFEVGVDVYTMDEDGNAMPCAAGEYIMEDGSMVVVGDDGKIAEVMQMGKKEEEEMSKEDMLSVIENLSERISVLETERAAATTKLASESEKALKFSSQVSKLQTELNSLKKQPATGSVKDKSVEHNFGRQTKTQEKTFAQMTLKERILANMPKNN
jgi:hypothetical protein